MRTARRHSLGSSHGDTRAIREAYYEHPSYVPFVRRAYELWDELSEACGKQLLRQTGALMVGREDGLLVPGAQASAEQHGIPHESLSPKQMRARFPMLTRPTTSAACSSTAPGSSTSKTR